MLDSAMTPEKRQTQLAKFFREAYAMVRQKFVLFNRKLKFFILPDFQAFYSESENKLNVAESQSKISLSSLTPAKKALELTQSVARMRLTRAEFAEALGMKENHLFIQRMFAAVAKMHKDTISFGEFLDVVKKFSRGL